jgi:hypothetical protein
VDADLADRTHREAMNQSTRLGATPEIYFDMHFVFGVVFSDNSLLASFTVCIFCHCRPPENEWRQRNAKGCAHLKI